MTLSDDDVKESKKMRNESKLKNRKESTVLSEKGKKKKKKLNNDNIDNYVKIRSDSHEKGEIYNCGNKVENKKVPFTLLEKEKKRETLNKTKCHKKMHTDDYREKQKKTSNGHNNAKSKKALTVSFENEKEREIKRWENPNTEKRMQSADDEKEEKKMCNLDPKVKNGKVPATLFEKKKEKMLSNDNVVKKMNEKKRDPPFSSEKNEMQNIGTKKKIMPMASVVKEKKLRPSKCVEMKMQSDRKQKKRNVVADVSKENKMETLNISNYKKRKREESPSLFKKDKKIHADDNVKNAQSVEMKEENIRGNSKEKKMKQPFAFFKCICHHFKEFLFVPPVAVPMLENFANHHVYLEDSEGKRSKVGLSVVHDRLAFHQGWSSFVSDHSINWGEFLLFEYIAKSTFSVRIFGRDSRERLTFDVESKRNVVGEKQPRDNRSSDDLLAFNGNSEDKDDEQCSDEYPRCNKSGPQKETLKYHVTVNTKDDPKGVEFRLLHRPSVALDKKDGNLINRQCQTKGTSPLRSKEYTMILISDSVSSLHENEDTVDLTTSNADSAMHLVTVNANESPKRVQIGLGNGASVVRKNKKGSLPSGECRTKCVSPTHSKEKTKILIDDAAPSPEENGDIVKLTTHLHRKEDISMIVESEFEAVAPTKYLQLLDSDQDLILEQEINFVEPTAVVDKYQNNSKLTINEKACRQHEAPGGFRCLEKWRKGIVSCRASFDGVELMKPKNPQTTDGKLVGDYSAIRLNPVNKSFFSEGTRACIQPIFTMLDENFASLDVVPSCEHSVAEINHDINGKGAAVQLQTKMQQLAPVGSIVGGESNNVCTLANYNVTGNYGAIGVELVGSEGFCASAESRLTMPVEKPSSSDKISKCGCSRPDIDRIVEVRGTAVQPVTNTDHEESMVILGSTVSNQSDSMPACANHVVARQSEHFSKQEDTKSTTSCVAQVVLVPVKTNILELDECSLLNINVQFCIPDSAQKWLVSIYILAGTPGVAPDGLEPYFVPLVMEGELPKALFDGVRQTRQDRNVIMLKDAMKRLWPVFYHENAVFVGFTAGWQHFVAANDLEAGDLCELLKEPDEVEPVYSVKITKK
ncbi:hypothetical protein ACP4OV_005984 [Aristida adscensionis]